MIHTITMVMSNVDGNNNKFWKADVSDNFEVIVTNGRMGQNGTKQPIKSFSSHLGAMKYVNSKQREKERKGYKVLDVIESKSSTNDNAIKIIEQAAKTQIRTKGDRKDIEDIVEKLIKLNIHSITTKTNITFDENSGLFMTSMGVVSLDSVLMARKFLSEISVFVCEQQDFTSKAVKKSLAEYLMLIPQKVPRVMSVKGVISDLGAIHKQNAILDDLEASIANIEEYKLAKKKQSAEEKLVIPDLFNCELSLLDNPDIEKMIKGIYNNTRKYYHASYSLEVERIFEVQVDSMTEAFDNGGNSQGNIMMLWHGSRAGNILSIMKNGLIIPPKRAGHVTGRMFGDGVYFSDQSTKSLNYSYGYWDGGQKDDVCYMFLCEVSMGRAYVPTDWTTSLPRAGFDSTFAVPGKSQVKNNEMIIYNTSKAKIRYLIEFKVK